MPVLVVDDDRDIRGMLRTLLELDNRRVIEAGDGEVAWKMILQHRAAVVVMDIHMPRLDGLTVCRKIRDYGFQQLKVILFTAHPVSGDDASEAGADEHLVKTDPLPRLRQAMRGFLLRYLHVESGVIPTGVAAAAS